ncbi:MULTISPECIES: hypothetical protein [Klebsiella]|uniref:hypothetical protein n=1 Tax=Klebsiella TaxID=570 RepID=UPI00105635BB|nr:MULTISPECIES: hypothetical protein [Klebsiella]UDC31133.1 hypothetical protein LGN97_12795 [Klebsiella variicola subsp. tropica]
MPQVLASLPPLAYPASSAGGAAIQFCNQHSLSMRTAPVHDRSSVAGICWHSLPVAEARGGIIFSSSPDYSLVKNHMNYQDEILRLN